MTRFFKIEWPGGTTELREIEDNELPYPNWVEIDEEAYREGKRLRNRARSETKKAFKREKMI